MMDERPEHKCEGSIPGQIQYLGKVRDAWYVNGDFGMPENPDSWGWYIEAHNSFDSHTPLWIKINYCPMCGIKLPTLEKK